MSAAPERIELSNNDIFAQSSDDPLDPLTELELDMAYEGLLQCHHTHAAIQYALAPERDSNEVFLDLSEEAPPECPDPDNPEGDDLGDDW